MIQSTPWNYKEKNKSVPSSGNPRFLASDLVKVPVENTDCTELSSHNHGMGFEDKKTSMGVLCLIPCCWRENSAFLLQNISKRYT